MNPKWTRGMATNATNTMELIRQSFRRSTNVASQCGHSSRHCADPWLLCTSIRRNIEESKRASIRSTSVTFPTIRNYNVCVGIPTIVPWRALLICSRVSAHLSLLLCRTFWKVRITRWASALMIIRIFDIFLWLFVADPSAIEKIASGLSPNLDAHGIKLDFYEVKMHVLQTN